MWMCWRMVNQLSDDDVNIWRVEYRSMCISVSRITEVVYVYVYVYVCVYVCVYVYMYVCARV